MSTGLLTAPTAARNFPEPRYSTCPPECGEASSCDFCLNPVCEEHPGEDGYECHHSCQGGAAHTECHRLECNTRDCWIDPDAAWDASHDEW